MHFVSHILSSGYGAGVGRDTGPQVRALLGHGACDGRPLHLPLVIDDDPRVVLEVYEHPVPPPEGLPLPDHHRWHYLEEFLALVISSENLLSLRNIKEYV